MPPKIVPGQADPLGATPDARGTNFAVASGGDQVRLCLFDADGTETQLLMPDRDGDVWHGFVSGIGPGQAYGFRVSGRSIRPAGCVTTPRSCCWTLMRAPSGATCGSGRRFSVIWWKILWRQVLWTQ
ncbi:MAG: hypothetical protein WCB92_23290 [Mycobacterium sp.]